METKRRTFFAKSSFLYPKNNFSVSSTHMSSSINFLKMSFTEKALQIPQNHSAEKSWPKRHSQRQESGFSSSGSSPTVDNSCHISISIANTCSNTYKQLKYICLYKRKYKKCRRCKARGLKLVQSIRDVPGATDMTVINSWTLLPWSWLKANSQSAWTWNVFNTIGIAKECRECLSSVSLDLSSLLLPSYFSSSLFAIPPPLYPCVTSWERGMCEGAPCVWWCTDVQRERLPASSSEIIWMTLSFQGFVYEEPFLEVYM